MPAESSQPLSVQDLVKALGGPANVGRELGLRTVAVSMWYAPGRNRIPPAHVLALWRLAQAKGLNWTPPGYEGLRLEPVTSHSRDDNDARMFPQCSHLDTAA